MIEWEKVKDFWDFVEFYPDEDEEGFDGVHFGGIKGLRKNAPDSAKKAFEKYQVIEREAIKSGIKI